MEWVNRCDAVLSICPFLLTRDYWQGFHMPHCCVPCLQIKSSPQVSFHLYLCSRRSLWPLSVLLHFLMLVNRSHVTCASGPPSHTWNRTGLHIEAHVQLFLSRVVLTTLCSTTEHKTKQPQLHSLPLAPSLTFVFAFFSVYFLVLSNNTYRHQTNTTRQLYAHFLMSF